MRNDQPSPVPLTVATQAEPEASGRGAARAGHLSWAMAAAAWTGAALLLGWCLVGVVVAAGWLLAPRLPAAQVIATMGQAWLALHGVPADLAGAHVDLTPWGATLVVAVACFFAAQHAARHTPVARVASTFVRWRAVGSVVAVCATAYAGLALVVASVVGEGDQVPAAVLGGVLVCLAGALPGALVGFGLNPLEDLPAWVRALPRAVGVGMGALAVAAVLAGLVALVAGWPRVSQLADALAPDAAGSALLVVVQLAWWPVVLLWVGSWLLGAGLTVGSGTLVAPGQSVIGALPAVPLLGALPVTAAPTDWLWLVLPVAAGGAAAWWLLRDVSAADVLPGRPLLASTGLGAAAGGLAGLGWWLLSWLATGSLGEHQLAGVGPRMDLLLPFAVGLLAAGGAAAGLGLTLWSTHRSGDPADLTEETGDAADR